MEEAHSSGRQTKESDANNTDGLQVKRVKLMKHEGLYIKDLPSCEAYERSYMHREHVTHVIVTQTQFLITASQDGVIKFWKKVAQGIEFVKKFKCHSGPIEDISVTTTGGQMASISLKDKTVKIFDVINFDMVNMFSLHFEPKCVEWINQSSISNENLLISDSRSNSIFAFDSRQSTNEPRNKIDKIHSAPVCRMRQNSAHNIIVSVDTEGIVKYWRARDGNYDRVKHPNATEDYDTVIHDFLRKKDDERTGSLLHNIAFSPDGKYMATTSSDRKIRIYKFTAGKLVREYDESLQQIEAQHKLEPLMPNMDFARRMAIEREIDKSNLTRFENAIFDLSGHLILFPTMLGVKVWNWHTNRLIRTHGRDETNFRPLCIALFQGLIYDKVVRRFNLDALESGVSDPTLFCTSYKKNRFFCFSNRHFEELEAEEGGEVIRDRDIYNEKPTRQEVMAAVEIEEARKPVYENATIYTSRGDIHLKLFPQLAPKACENFSVHAKNGYYNNHIFHRVIEQFMIQTGDPTGTGTGGESIWEEEFSDEFCQELRHDKPFVLSMANCGPNTNGSQFFITVAPCTFLDDKHTIFGRVVKGMDVCLSISKTKTDPATDKPYDDIKIINIVVH